MRLLADEGVDRSIVTALRDGGHDVLWTAEEMEGAKDSVVLDAAARDSRILITEDKDFGELVHRQRRGHRGVVLVRLDGIANARKGEIVAQAIRENASRLTGAFAVIEHTTIRIRRPS